MSEGPRAPVLRYLRQAVGAPPAGAVSDADLLARFAAGRDEAAFELLLWRHGGMVLNVCRAVLRDADAAEDAFQATFLVLVRKAGSISRREAVGGWLYRVAYRAALKARRRAAAVAERLAAGADLEALPAAEDGGADAAALREVQRLLCEEVQRLPPRYRAPVVACYFEGRTHEEAAGHLGWSKGTLAGRLARARELLHRRLARRGVALGVGCLAVALAPGAASAATLAPLINPTLQAAARFAAGAAVPAASAPAAALAEGVLRTMLWTRMKLAAAAVLAVALAGSGAVFTGRPAAGAQDGPAGAATPKPRAVANKKAADSDPRLEASARAASRKNLMAIALAMHEYSNQNGGRLPAPAIYGKDRKALLSWRVAILPYLEQDALYKQFHLDEPWDSPHNKKLLEVVPKTYVPVGGAKAPPGSTFYQVFVGKGAAFENNRQMTIPASFPDGTANTILVVEAGKPVPWTKPEDIDYPEDKPLPPLGGLFKDVFQAAFVDGSPYTLKKKCDERILRLAILRDDGNAYDLNKLLAGFAPQASSAIKDLMKDLPDLGFLSAARQRELQRQREMAEATRRQADVEKLRETLKKEIDQNARLVNEINKMRDLAVAAEIQFRAVADRAERMEKELRKLQDQVAALREEIRRLKQDREKPVPPKRGP
jgi:RNA polymerase sigma factor (sigma-70 family)